MPSYEASCRDCGHEYTYIAGFSDYLSVPPCPICKSLDVCKEIRTAPGIRPDVHDWSMENNGKGRYIDQLQRTMGKVKDENAYCKNQQHAIDKAQAMGHTVEKTR